MNPLRVLVVEDSLTMRKYLCEVLAAAPGVEIVAEAEDGKQAIELCRELRPDLVTMDMMMPVMSGLSATEYIMAHCPTPILVVSASTNRGELFKTYEALAAGAVDVMDKPHACDTDGDWERRFIATARLVARIKVITRMRRQPYDNSVGARVNSPLPVREDSRPVQLIAIGASTGGPGAIAHILRALPAPIPLPVLLLLHIGDPFGGAFADWLDSLGENRVSLAQDGQPLMTPGIYLAPPGAHLVAENGRLRLSSAPPRHSCRPSVDVLFESLALERGAAVAACLLTGMGADGARGLLAIRQAGGLTIAQDEASCIVYGMPREAALLGAAQFILPLSEIAPTLVRQAIGRHRTAGKP